MPTSVRLEATLDETLASGMLLALTFFHRLEDFLACLLCALRSRNRRS